MSDVFVSYKAEDRKRVKPLVEALQAEGFSVWWDEQIGGGAAWRSAIESELNAAKCVIVIWSNRSVGPDGTFVQVSGSYAVYTIPMPPLPSSPRILKRPILSSTDLPLYARYFRCPVEFGLY